MADRVRARIDDGGSYFTRPKDNLKFIKSGSHMLDLALGGGWVRNRISNVVGNKSTGKTLLMIEACANFAASEPKAKLRYREAESAFDQQYAKTLGMPVDKIDFGEPMETVEDLFEDMEKVIAGARTPELYILDSLDALSDRAELEREMDKGTFGAQKAKNLSQLFRRLVRKLERKQVTVIIVSQVRSKIGMSFGRDTTRSGGRALDFYASQVAYLDHVGTLKRTIRGQTMAYGLEIRAKIDKNKVALPLREARFDILFGYGVDDAVSCADYLKAVKALKEIGVSDTGYKAYVEALADMPSREYRAEIKRLNAACTKVWYEIERKLLPTRTKYEVGV